jgi:hypothetical protein
MTGDIEIPDHPLVREVMKDTLTEAMDLEGLLEVLAGIADGTIRCIAVDTPVPSVFAHELINAMPYAFLDPEDAAARRTRAVSTRGNLPSRLPEAPGRLDPAAIATVRQQLWPDIRDEHELHDLLLQLIALPLHCLDTLGAPGPDSRTWVLPEHTPLETRWIFDRLHAVTIEVDRALTNYRFDEAANAVYQFFWGELCDWYLELVKLRLVFPEYDFTKSTHNDITALTLASLTGVFESALRLLSPFMPFITEEIWHAFYDNATPAKSIALTRFPQPEDIAADAVSVSAMEIIQQLIVTVRGLRKEMAVPEKEPAPIRIFANNRVTALADANTDLLARLARVSTVEFASEPLTGDGARSTPDFDVAVVYERQIDVPAERERLTKDLAKFEKGLTAAERQLGNEAFMAKAPAPIVDGLRKQHAETKILHDKAKAALDALK